MRDRKDLQSSHRELQQTMTPSVFRSSLLALCIAVFSVAAIQFQQEGLTTDFPSFYSASGVLTRGENPYNIHALHAYAQERGIDSEVYPYLYPPFLASVISPMSTLSPESADRTWGAMMVVVFAVSVVLVSMVPHTGQAGRARSSRRRLVWESALAAGILLFLPFGENFLKGQVNAIVMACMTFAVLGTEREGRAWEWGAGAALAVAALIKVTPALLLVLFVARRKTGALQSFLLAGAAGIGLSVLLSGTEVWGQFLAFLPHTSYGRSIDGMFHPIFVTNLSLSGFFMRAAETSGPIIRLASMLAALSLLATLLWAVFRGRSVAGRQGLLLALLIVMTVVSPYTWLHHMVFLYPGAFLMLRDMVGRSEERPVRRLLVLSALCLAGATMNFPELYPLMGIPETIWGFATSLNLFFLLGLFALALRWSGMTRTGERSVPERKDERRNSWLDLLPLPVRGF